MNKNFLYLIDALKSLPGVTTKQAKNIAYFLINKDEFFIETFINRIRELKLHVNYCTQCNNLVEDQMLCPICEDTHRDTSQLCIVNSSDDLNKIEATESYRGLYFTL
jgi:recombination protein RecR